MDILPEIKNKIEQLYKKWLAEGDCLDSYTNAE